MSGSEQIKNLRRKRRKKIWLALTGLFLVLLIALALGVPIPLGFLAPRFESMIGSAIGRAVALQGPIRLSLSREIELRVEGIVVSNPPEWQEADDFLRLQEARVRIDLPRLLRRGIAIPDLELSGLELHAMRRSDGAVNWNFARKGADDAVDQQGGMVFEACDQLLARELVFTYRDATADRAIELELNRVSGKAARGDPIELEMNGLLAGHTLSISARGDELGKLLDRSSSWRLHKASLSTDDLAANGSGELQRGPDGLSASFNLGLDGKGLPLLDDLFGLSMTGLEDFSAEAVVQVEANQYRVSDLSLDLLGSSLQADLAFARGGDLPRLSGKIAASKLDIDRLLGVSVAFPGKEGAGVAADEPAPADAPAVDLAGRMDLLRRLDTDLTLAIHSASYRRVDVEDASVVLELAGGRLIAPFSVKGLGTRLAGEIDCGLEDGVPGFALALTSDTFSLDQLDALLEREITVDGLLGAFEFVASTQGSNLEELIEGLDFDLQLGPTLLRDDDGPIFQAGRLGITRSRAECLFAAQGDGHLFAWPFQLDTSIRTCGGNDAAESAEPPISLALSLGDMQLGVTGSIQTGGDSATGRLDFSLQGQDACGLLQDFIPEDGQGFSIQGGVTLTEVALKLDLASLKFAETRFDGTAELRLGPEEKLVVNTDLHAGLLDIGPFLKTPGKAPADDVGDKPDELPAEGDAMMPRLAQLNELLDRELIPAEIDWLDFRLQAGLRIDQFRAGTFEMHDIALQADMADGVLEKAPFEGTFAGQRVAGNLAFDLGGTEPGLDLVLSTEDLNLQRMSTELGLRELPEITVDEISFSLDTRGSTIRDLLRQSRQELAIRGGHYALPRNLSDPLDLRIDEILYLVAPGQNPTLDLRGTLGGQPLNLHLTERGLFSGKPDTPFELDMQLTCSQTKLSVTSGLDRQAKQVRSLSLRTILTGPEMGDLNPVFGLNLPPFGPYVFDSSLLVDGTKLSFHDVLLQVNESMFRGRFEVTPIDGQEEDGDGPRVAIQSSLEAEKIQLDDFQVGDWSPFRKGRQESAPAGDGEAAAALAYSGGESAVASDERKKPLELISPELAGYLSGSIRIDIREVLSGLDHLGDGHLYASMDGGRIRLDDLQLNIPGGGLSTKGELVPREDGLSMALSMEMLNMDYGVLLRRFNLRSRAGGILNLALDLQAEAPTPRELARNLNGYMRIGVIPDGMRAGIVDLWAVNILTSALPVLLKGGKSEVNCVAGNFNVEDGLITPDVFLLDTTRIRVGGRGMVDLKTGDIDFLLRPTPKSPQFFSLSTPVQITGKISDFDIGLGGGGIIGTLLRQVYSVVVVPVQWVFSKRLKPDGQAACSEAMQWATADEENSTEIP
jgi:uncharacterized protein involved in outer membrane biogenesis